MCSPKIKIENLLGTKIFWILLLTSIVLIFWYSTIDVPYWWDSAGYIIHGAKYYIDTNFSSFILPSTSEISAFAHPPLFPFLLAITWKIFGESLLVSHTFYLIFILLAVLFTYLLGKEIANFDKLTNNVIGFSAALILLFTPVFLAQLGIIYVEIPTAAFALMAVYFFLKRKFWWYLLSASLMLFMKEASVVIILAILGVIFLEFLIEFFEGRKGTLRKRIKESIAYSLPILLLVAWFVLHKVVTGWMFVMPYYQSQFGGRAFTFGKMFFGQLALVFKFFFFEQRRFLITFSILLFLSFAFFRERLRKIFLRENILLLFLIIIFVPLIFAKLEFLSRYIIFGLPFFYILFLYGLVGFLRQLKLKTNEIIGIMGEVIFVILIIFSLSWNDHQVVKNWHFPPFEENLAYLDVIYAGQETSSFIERYYPDAVVWTAFPSNYMLSEPFQHYVSKPIKVRECKDYRRGDRVDLVVFHFLSPGERDCLKMMNRNFFLLASFGRNGKWMQIYKNRASKI